MNPRIWIGTCFALAAGLFIAATSTSCDGDESTVAGTGGGGASACPTTPQIDDTPPDDPGPPRAAPTVNCGTPTFPTGTPLRRYPYLQSTTHDSVRIAWTATSGSVGTVRVAPGPDGPWTEVTANDEAFPVSRTNDTEDYTAFDATVENLEPDAAYCYEVLVDGTPVATGLSFQTAWTDPARPVRILAFGDSGNNSPEQRALRDTFMEREFDVFLHLGDMAYSDGLHTEFEERVFGIYKDFMHAVPSYPTLGNHEYRSGSPQAYLDVYYLFEQALRAEDQEKYYSFDYADVHFISLDSNGETIVPIQFDAAGTIDDDMIDWLEADLAATTKPWKIAFFHHPPFSLYADRGDNGMVLNTIMPALSAGGVDLILVGHDHHYVRSLPFRGDCRVPGGEGAIPFILVGSGGTGLRPIEDDDDWYVAASNDKIHAFLSLTIQGCKGSGEAIGLDGSVIDSFELNGCK